MAERIGSLEIDQNLRFQERSWTVQRLGWIGMMLLIVLALAGLFGTGPLSTATAGDPHGPISVDYQRFVRHDGRASLTIRVSSDQISGNEAEVWLDAAYVDSFQIQQITPQPDEVRSGEERLIYVFAVEDASQPFQVSFSLSPQHIGRVSGEAGIVGGPSESFDQLSYP